MFDVRIYYIKFILPCPDFCFSKRKERLSKLFVFVDKIEKSDKKKFNYFKLSGNICLGHCRGHNTLIIGIFSKSWEFRH